MLAFCSSVWLGRDDSAAGAYLATFFGRRHLGSCGAPGCRSRCFSGAVHAAGVEVRDQVGDYDGAFYTVAVLNFAAAVLLMFIRKPTRKVAAAEA